MLINGTGSVMFFFVLSGYVLTVRFFQTSNTTYVGMAIFKRLPRLALLTTFACVGSALLWRFGLYHYEEAASLTGSVWIKPAMAGLPQDYHPSLLSAFAQGAWRTFLVGDNSFDTSLWTMRHEFDGSLLVFLAAPFVVFVLKNRLAWLGFALALVVLRNLSPLMVPFICGMGIAYYARDFTF